MDIHKENQLFLAKTVLLALLNGLLFLPVLRLFSQLNDYPSSDPLLYFLLATQLIQAFIPWWAVWLPFQFLALSGLFYVYFPYGYSFGFSWLRYFLEQTANQFFQFVNGEITIIPQVLALLILTLFVIFASYFLLKYHQPLISVLTNLGYLMILQTFTTNDTLEVLMHVIGFSLTIIGTAALSERQSWRSFMLTLLMLSGLSFLFLRLAYWGMDGWTEQQKWAQQSSESYRGSLADNGFFDFIDQYSSGANAFRSGYSENDEQLGGPLQQDFTTVFTAYTDEPHYWRIATKTVYTGKGWIEEGIENPSSILFPIADLSADPNVQADTDTVLISLEDSFTYYPYTYGAQSLAPAAENEQLTAFLASPSEKLTVTGEDAAPVKDYNLNIFPLPYDETLLQQPLAESQEFFLENSQAYTQLPDSVPERVHELAQTIIEGHATQYDQVKAIESYLKNTGGFRYSLRETTFLPEGRDYVDYFLFDSKIGYCDNFSTAMIVLCRAVGIPTQWTKGFSSGTLVNDQTGGTYYQITNANAHSWPEVYFPGYGWVPFEPTPSFNQTATSPDTSTNNEDAAEADVPAAEQNTPEANNEPQAESEAASAESANSAPETSETVDEAPVDQEETDVFMRYFVILFLLGLGLFGLAKRFRIISWLIEQLMKTSFLSLKQRLALILWLFELKRKRIKSRTVRSYFEEWIPLIPGSATAVQLFIHYFETAHYADQSEKTAISAEQNRCVTDMLHLFNEAPVSKNRS